MLRVWIHCYLDCVGSRGMICVSPMNIVNLQPKFGERIVTKVEIIFLNWTEERRRGPYCIWLFGSLCLSET